MRGRSRATLKLPRRYPGRGLIPSIFHCQPRIARRRREQQVTTQPARAREQIGRGRFQNLRVSAKLALFDCLAAVCFAASRLIGAAATRTRFRRRLVGEQAGRFQAAVLRGYEPQSNEQHRQEAIARSAHAGKRGLFARQSQSRAGDVGLYYIG